MGEVSLSVLPKSGLAGINENWRSDLIDGFWGFLSVLPHKQKMKMAINKLQATLI